VRDDGGSITVRLDHDAQSLAAETAGNWLEYYVHFLDGAAKGN